MLITWGKSLMRRSAHPMPRTCFSLGVLVLVPLLTALVTGQSPPTVELDEAQLRAGGVPTDGPGLLDYFRQRTLREADRAKLRQKIKLLGDKSYEVRRQASAEFVRAGRAALPILQPALNHADSEIARRAGLCIQAI